MLASRLKGLNTLSVEGIRTGFADSKEITLHVGDMKENETREAESEIREKFRLSHGFPPIDQHLKLTTLRLGGGWQLKATGLSKEGNELIELLHTRFRARPQV